MATVFLWLLWFLRLFSLLQIAKLVFRQIATLFRKATKDRGSKRVNVPPMFVEIYYILWLTAMILFKVLDLFPSPWVRAASMYFVLESVVWVLYYTIFRRFFEESYSLYHILEYFVVLFILIPTQALALSGLYAYPFLQALAGFVGASNDATPIPIKIMGSLNAAIVVALVISSFPAEASKTSGKTQENYIIGNGDVVKNRLLPSLKSAGAEPYALRVYDIRSPERGERDRAVTVIEKSEDIIPTMDKKLNSRSVVWIETPVSSHVPLLKQALTTDAALIVLEKPITRDRSELAEVRLLLQNDAVRNRVFFLSYYLLEKALPLYYLADHNASYARYLNISDKELALRFRNYIGQLKSVEVCIYEGGDRRPWAFDGAAGQLFETFIHNMILASLFAELPKHWKGTEIKWSDEGEGKPKIISLKAACADATIDLRQGKFIPLGQQTRYASFTFTNGVIYADLERKSASVTVTSLDRTAEITLKEQYQGNYAVQTALVNSVFLGENSAEDVDGLRNQLEIIEFLLDYLEKNGLG